MLLLLTLTLPMNAVSAATINQTTTDDSDHFDKAISSTETDSSDNNYENTTTSIQTNTTTTDTSLTNTTRYEGTDTDSNTSNSGSEIAAGSALAAGSTTIINILIYSGTYAASSCVSGLKTALSYANSNNLLNGVQFTYGTSTVINAATLSGYDVLYMPGGSGGWYYLNYGNIDGTAIKNFVANGGGYLGICAGAYAAVANVDGWYSGWGIAPHVNAKVVNYEGTTNMQITSAGEDVLGRSGTVSLAHYNGAAMYVTSGAVIFGTYADGKTGYQGYADIVGDYYGSGRTVLIGSHPELAPQYPDILANLIAWAANVQVSDPDPNSATLSQVATASSSVKSFYETNKRLPNYVTINNNQITMPQFLYLLATGTNQAYSGSTAAITIKNVNEPTSSSGSNTAGSILKSEFESIAQNVISYINTNSKAPGYVSTSLGNMSYENVVYMFSKIMTYYQTNNRLPNFVTMTASSSTTPTPDPTPTTVTMAQIGSASSTVKSYYESNKALPSSVTIASQSVTMSSLLNLLTTATIQANSGSTAAITLKNVNEPTSSSGSNTAGSILKSEFESIAQNVISYINTNSKAPGYVSTSLGNMSYENVVYMFSKIMTYYQTNNRLPNFVTMTASSSTTPTPDPTPTTVTMAQIGSASSTVKSYYESNKALPSSVTIASQSVTMSSLLNLLTTATIQANSGSTAAITLKTVDAATSYTGSIKSGNIQKSEFLSIAQTIQTYINTNGKAPNYISTSLGNMNFDKAVYMFSKIMNYYKTNSRLPNYVSIA